MKTYNVNGKKITAEQWKNIASSEMNEIMEYQECGDYATDNKGKEYMIVWKPYIIEA